MKAFSAVLGCLLAAAAFGAEDSAPIAEGRANCEGTGLIVPAYFGDTGDWKKLQRLLSQNPGSRALVIINAASGPGALEKSAQAALVAKFQARRRALRAAGPNVRVIGYVAVGYFDFGTYFGAGRYLSAERLAQARRLLQALKPSDRGAITAAIPGVTEERLLVMLAAGEDVRRWYEWYPGIDGIFFDEAPSRDAALFQRLADQAASLAGGREASLVYNPGTKADVSAYPRAAAACLFEDSTGFDEFLNGVGAPENARTCALLYGVSERQAARAWTEACARGLGWFYATDRRLPNPWLRLPRYLGAERP